MRVEGIKRYKEMSVEDGKFGVYGAGHGKARKKRKLVLI
jgi:hypothetical protein